jgi:hypothetical protein
MVETHSLTAKGRQCVHTFAPENGFFLYHHVNAQLLALAFTMSAIMFPAVTVILFRLAGWRIRRPMLFT